MKQGRTKDEPKNSQLQKVLFIKNPISFTSLIGCSIPPSDDRETTEGTPQQLRTSKKCILLRNLVCSTTLDILKKSRFAKNAH